TTNTHTRSPAPSLNAAHASLSACPCVASPCLLSIHSRLLRRPNTWADRCDAALLVFRTERTDSLAWCSAQRSAIPSPSPHTPAAGSRPCADPRRTRRQPRLPLAASQRARASALQCPAYPATASPKSFSWSSAPSFSATSQPPSTRTATSFSRKRRLPL